MANVSLTSCAELKRLDKLMKHDLDDIISQLLDF